MGQPIFLSGDSYRKIESSAFFHFVSAIRRINRVATTLITSQCFTHDSASDLNILA